ncbi:MAG: hypothetical protein JNL01_01665 [Bdellovibrionales bacterium]|nr:hypothetical protein [Bdellovibrionales bacterium]
MIASFWTSSRLLAATTAETSLKHAQISAKISPWKDPKAGLHSESIVELNTAADYVVERRVGKFPEFVTRLRVWLHLPGFTSASPRLEGEADTDPVGSPFPIKVDSRVLGVWLDQRTLSIPVYLRPNPNELIERWVHIEVLGSRPYSDTDPSCLSVGLELETVQNMGSHLWTHMTCFVTEDQQIYAGIFYPQDAKLTSKKWNTFHDMGPGYVWINLLKFNARDLPVFEIRKAGTENASFYRLKIRSVVEDRTVRSFMGIGMGVLTIPGQTVLNVNGTLGMRRQPKDSIRSFTIEANGSALSLWAQDKSQAALSLIQPEVRMGWKVPVCILGFLDLECEPTFGIAAQVILSGLGLPTYFGPQVGLNLLEEASGGRSFGFFRYAPMLSQSSSFAFSRGLFEAGFAFDLSAERTGPHTYLLLKGGIQSNVDSSGSALSSQSFGVTIQFEVGGSR